ERVPVVAGRHDHRQGGDRVDRRLQAVGVGVVIAQLGEELHAVVEGPLGGHEQVGAADLRGQRQRPLVLRVGAQVAVCAGAGLAAGGHADVVADVGRAGGVGHRLHVEGAGAAGHQRAVAAHRLGGGEVAPGAGGAAGIQGRVALEAGADEVEAAVRGAGPVVVVRVDARRAVVVERQGQVAAQVVGVLADDAADAPVVHAGAFAGAVLDGDLAAVHV